MNVDAFTLDAIQQTVGKLWHQNPSEPAAKRPANGRRLNQALVRALNGEDEIEAEPFRLALVEAGCRNELALCLWMKLNASHRSAERAFLMTLAAGIPTT